MFVAPDQLGTGVGSQALHRLCQWGFEHLDLNRIFLYTLGSNGGALRFYMKNGFLHEGTLRQHAFVRGTLEDRHILAMLKEDWFDVRTRESVSED